jgi:hypothetical protein
MALYSPKNGNITPDEYIERYDLAGLSQQHVVRKIAKELSESGLMKDRLSGKTNVYLEAQVMYLDTLVEQNWLILK